MTRIRVEWRRGPGVMFLSHLDLVRTIERALRRACIPVDMTQGYNPRPRMAFSAPLSLGVTGYAEVLDLWLAEPMDDDQLVSGLAGALPQGISVVRARTVAPERPSLQSVVDAAWYRVAFFPGEDAAEWERLVSGGQVDRHLSGILERENITLTRSRPGKPDREVNVRPFVINLIHDGDFRLRALVRVGSAGNVRPRELLEMLSEVSDGFIARAPWTTERLATGRWDGHHFIPAWDL